MTSRDPRAEEGLRREGRELAAVAQKLGTLGEGESPEVTAESSGKPIRSLNRIDSNRETLPRSGLAMLPRQVRDQLRMYGCPLRLHLLSARMQKQMHMGIDESRHHRRLAQIDCIRAREGRGMPPKTSSTRLTRRLDGIL